MLRTEYSERVIALQDRIPYKENSFAIPSITVSGLLRHLPRGSDGLDLRKLVRTRSVFPVDPIAEMRGCVLLRSWCVGHRLSWLRIRRLIRPVIHAILIRCRVTIIGIVHSIVFLLI